MKLFVRTDRGPKMYGVQQGRGYENINFAYAIYGWPLIVSIS